MKKNKQFKDFLNEDLFLDLIDVESQAKCVEHFYDRYVTDDNKFVSYFNRNIKLVADQYYNMCRVESIQFDPMVTKYLEEEEKIRRTKSMTGTDTTSETTSGSLQNSGIITVKTDNETTDNVSTDVTNSQQGSVTDNVSVTATDDYTNEDTIRTRDLESNTPHSNVSSSTTGGLMSPISWTYASGLVDHGEDNTHTHDGDSTSTTTGTHATTNSETSQADTTGSTVLDGTQITTRGDGQTTSGTKSVNKTKGSDDTENVTNQKIFTGREGIPADLLDKARNYLRKSKSIEWLFDELEICFMPDLLYGEEF